MFWLFKRKSISWEELLKNLISAWVKLSDGVSLDDIKKSFNLDLNYKKEKEFYEILYTYLWWYVNDDESMPVSKNVWHVDFESIEGEWDYSKILENINRISQSELKILNIQDSLDIDSKKVNISFSINWEPYNFTLEQEDDYINEELFTKIDLLSDKYGTKWKLMYFWLWGQDVVLSWLTEDERENIQKLSKFSLISWKTYCKLFSDFLSDVSNTTK